MLRLCDLSRVPQIDEHEARAAALRVNPLNAPLQAEDERQVAMWQACWGPNRAVNVGFLGGSAIDQRRVKDVVQLWEKQINVFFIFDSAAPADIRISFDPNDGNWSALGTMSTAPAFAGRASMNLSNRDPSNPTQLDAATILHEFGHALGFYHEHQHPNCTISWIAQVFADLGGPPNNWPRDKVQHQVVDRLDPRAKFITGYDPSSIMHYEIPASWNAAGLHIGPNLNLSTGDIASGSQLYPATKLLPIVAPSRPPVEMSLRADPYAPSLLRLELAAGGRYRLHVTGAPGLAELRGPNSAEVRISPFSWSGAGRVIDVELDPGTYLLRACASDKELDVVRFEVTGPPTPERVRESSVDHTYKIYSGDKVELVAADIEPGGVFHVTFGDPDTTSSYTRPFQGEVLDLVSRFQPGNNQVNLRHISNDGPWHVQYELRINGVAAPGSPFVGSGNAWWLDRLHRISNLMFLYSG